MTTTLRLYNETGVGPTSRPVEFPGPGDDWAYIADYKYSATRMSSAPNITATLKWPRCLDKEWSTNVFVRYNNERYFIKNTPSSSYDNTSCLYSHSLELVSERAVLDSVYFLNVPTKVSGDGENTQGDSLSDSSDFSFSGDIVEFVDRLNKSLTRSGIGGISGYSAVVDEGVISETKLFSISNQYVTDVLKNAYELYEVPYYFVGKTIHFGNQQTDIQTPLEYGADKSLLSVSKSNSSKQVVTRITGSGSDRNIPYYYPNPTPKGKLKLEGTASSKYEIVDQLAFSANVELDFPIIYKQAEGRIGASNGTPVTDSEYGEITVINEVGDYAFYFQGHDIVYKLECTCDNQSGYLPNFVPLMLGFDQNMQQANWADFFISGEVRNKRTGAFITAITRESAAPSFLGFEEHPNRRSGLLTYVIFFRGPKIKRPVYISAYQTGASGESFSFDSYKIYKATTGVFEADMEVVVNGGSGRGHVYSTPTMYVDGVAVQGTIDLFKGGELYEGDSIITHPYRKDNSIYLGKLYPGTYHLKSKFTLPTDASLTNVDISYSTTKHSFWEVVAKGADVDIKKAGLELAKFSIPVIAGDTLIQKIDYRIDVKTTLMPSEYRRTLGKNMWYNATNLASRGEWYGDVEFDNEYDSRHPVEYIHTDEDIYPTIKGVTNGAGENIDTFIDIAFDRDDNNEIYPEDYEDENLAGKYKHPYFFVKLKKTDGANGFNLFDHAIEGEAMKISFTTGHVAGCEFEIGVDEETQKNPVQVDENGDLVRDPNSGDIIIRGDYIESQQDTQNNEVWIALKKEDITMGVMMPDTTSQLIPLGDLLVTGDKREGGGDKFVILGIHLPEAYITAAEDKLEKALLEYLKENNKEKFSFSIKFSSIYLAENPEISKTINENCKLSVVYNDEIFSMYATSYSVTVKDGVALPEVVVNIDNELKVVKPKVKDVSSVIDSTEIKIKDVKKSIRDANASIKTLSTNSNDISNQVNTLIGKDAWMSAREIAEDVTNPIDERVSILIENDANKSVRTIANEVLAGASTGGGIDLDLYLSKSEAEATYEKKSEVDAKIDTVSNVLETKADKSEVYSIGRDLDTLSHGFFTIVGGESLLTLTKTSACYAAKTATAYVSNSNGWYVMWFKASKKMRIRYKLGSLAASNAAQIASSTSQPAPGVSITVLVKEQASNTEGYLDVEKDTYIGSIGSSDDYIVTFWEQLEAEKNYLTIVDSHDNQRVSTLAPTYFNGVRLVDTMTQQRFGRSTATKIGNFTPVSATSDTITLSSADASCFTGVVILSCKMYDGKYRNIYFSAASGNVITKLYDFGQNIDCQNIVEMESLHDTVQGAGGIHLSPYGYRSMAQVIYDDLQTKKPFSDVFVGGWTAQFCLGGGWNDSRIRDADGNVICIPTLDGISTGGKNECYMIYKANSPSDGPYYRTYYSIMQTSPSGGTATFRLNALYPFKGFLRVGASRRPDDDGSVNIIVKDFDGNTIGTKAVAQYADIYIFELNDKYYQGVDVVIEMPDATSSSIRIAEMTMHETYVQTAQIRPINASSSVALLGSSNTQYPPLDVVESLCPDDPDNVLVTRPDGTIGEGCGYLGKQLARLSGATIDNWGKSGEKTPYGLDKIQEIFAHKRYTHIILSLFANDLNASVPMAQIVDNIRMMVEYAKGHGCIPIVLMGYGVSGSLTATTYGRMYDVLTQGLSSTFIYTSGHEHV